MAAAKKVAPTHPHPWAPDVPPVGMMAGAAAGVVDRAGDLVAKILGRSSTSNGHKSATKVRASAEKATDAVIESVQTAKRASKAPRKAVKRTTRSTAKKTGAAAKNARTTVRKTAKKTTAAAKRAR
jgi:hypothetical protein